MNRKGIILILPLLIFLSFDTPNGKRHIYENQFIKCKFETVQGRLHGNYESFYRNGKRKSKGRFENNYRTGKWTVWDTTGKIRMQRIYSAPFNFKRIIPEVPNDKLIKLLNNSEYQINYNEEGYIEYFDIYERSVVWKKRLIRFIDLNENPILTNDNRLISIITNNVMNGNINTYKIEGRNWNVNSTRDFDTTNKRLIGFNLLEETFFDDERLVTESRIIGICPVLIDSKKIDSLNEYWIYFPELRKYLAKEMIQESDVPRKIKTLDDLFFYRYFYGAIIQDSFDYVQVKASNFINNTYKIEAEHFEIELIEKENDTWLEFSK
jgi:hypothetical protein